MKLNSDIRATVIVSLVLIASLIGCASTKQQSGTDALTEEQFNLEELLGETDAQKTADEQKKVSDENEGEVLRLLGITKEEKADTQTLTQAEKAAVEPEKQGELQTQITELEKKIEGKDIELATLKTDLAKKEERVGKLEEELQALRSQETVKPATAPTTFKGRYQLALEEYEKRQYQRAAALFEELLVEDASNSLSDNCQYWLGECYYGLGDYNQSLLEFQKVFTFSESNKEPDSQLKIALCYLQMGDKVRAKEEFQRLITNYPDSEYVSKAQYYLDRI